MSKNFDMMTHDELVIRSVTKCLKMKKEHLVIFLSESYRNAINELPTITLKKILVDKIIHISKIEKSYDAHSFVGLSYGIFDEIVKERDIPGSLALHILARNIERYEQNNKVTL